MKDTCAKLNLACHEFRQKDGTGFQQGNLGSNIQEHKIYSPGDCEVHKGRDKRMYVVDMARFFPVNSHKSFAKKISLKFLLE